MKNFKDIPEENILLTGYVLTHSVTPSGNPTIKPERFVVIQSQEKAHDERIKLAEVFTVEGPKSELTRVPNLDYVYSYFDAFEHRPGLYATTKEQYAKDNLVNAPDVVRDMPVYTPPKSKPAPVATKEAKSGETKSESEVASKEASKTPLGSSQEPQEKPKQAKA